MRGWPQSGYEDNNDADLAVCLYTPVVGSEAEIGTGIGGGVVLQPNAQHSGVLARPPLSVSRAKAWVALPRSNVSPKANVHELRCSLCEVLEFCWAVTASEVVGYLR